MRIGDVPQDGNAALSGERKAMYALDENGCYAIVPSTGWEVEEAVTLQAVEALKQQADAALARARAGLASPLEYHMARRRMDVAILAQFSGIARWRIRRHFRADVWTRLPQRLLVRYADALGISVAELQALD